MNNAEPRVAESAPRVLKASYGSLALAIPVALLALLLWVAPASAAFLHSAGPPSEEFGPDGTPSSMFGIYASSMAIDQASQRLYLLDEEEAVREEPLHIYGFDLSNSHAALGGNFPLRVPRGGGNNVTREVVVDNSNGPAAGNIYYLAIAEQGRGNSELYGFTSSGQPLGGEYPVEIPEPASGCGIAVDSEGNVWVADRVSRTLLQYEPDGLPTGKKIPVAGLADPCSFTFNLNNDDVYVLGHNPNNGNEYHLWRYSAASDYRSILELPTGGPLFDSTHELLYLGRSIYNADGEPIETIGEGADREGGVAMDESTGTFYSVGGTYNYGLERFELRIRVFPKTGIIPEVKTEGAGGSTVHATVDPAGGGNVTSCTFEFGTSTSYGSSVACEPPTEYAGVTAVSAELPGLTDEVQYHYRVKAGNATGTNIGADQTFVPHHVQDLATDPATNLAKQAATLNGSYIGNGQDTHYYFEWGLTTAYGSETAAAPGDDNGSGAGPQSMSSGISGLEPGTTYHYRVVAENAGGISDAADRTFSTLPAVTDLTASLTNLRGNSATLNGTWTGDGTDTHYYFEWGATEVYGHVTAAPPGDDKGSGTGAQHVEADLIGLLPKSYYHYRLVASNPSGTTATADRIFRTPQLPAVGYKPALKMTTSSAELRGTVNPQETGPTTYHFDYGPTTSYGASTPESASVGADIAVYPAGATIEGLSPGTTYHYRIVASSPTGVTFGADKTLTTVPNSPTVTETSASDIHASTVTLGAEVKPGFGQTVVYFQYGVEPSYGTSTIPGTPLPEDDVDHSVSSAVSDLATHTTYHYRAVAVNFAGVSYGPDQTFTTQGPPKVSIGSPSNLSRTSGTVSGGIEPSLSQTTYRFEYGPTEAYGASTAAGGPLAADDNLHSVSADLTGLQPGTTYHYRLVASNEIGAAVSPDETFTTAPAEISPPPPPTPSCHKGQILRHGKCVRKPHKKHHHKRNIHKHHGRAR